MHFCTFEEEAGQYRLSATLLLVEYISVITWVLVGGHHQLFTTSAYGRLGPFPFHLIIKYAGHIIILVMMMMMMIKAKRVAG